MTLVRRSPSRRTTYSCKREKEAVHLEQEDSLVFRKVKCVPIRPFQVAVTRL
jgi:hypothetical protein